MYVSDRSGRLPLRKLFPFVVLAAGFVLALLALTRVGADDGSYRVVTHTFTLSPDGTFIIDEETSTKVSAQFVVNNHTWAASAIPVAVKFNSANEPAGLETAELIQQAISTWNGAGSGFSFSWQGSSSGDTGSCADQIDTDGLNTISFVHFSGLTLGKTCTVYPPGANSKLLEFDMQLDDDAPWSAILPVPGNKYDLGSTLLHELGHAAGLGHSAESAATMFFQIGDGDNKRTLTADDIAGIQAAYPALATPTPTAPPTASPTPTVIFVPPSVPVQSRARAPLLARD